MTCSLQTYRIRIGIYANGQHNYKKKCTKYGSQTTELRGKFILFFIFASYGLLVLVGPTLSQLQNQNPFTGTGWRLCPCTSTYIPTASYGYNSLSLLMGRHILGIQGSTSTATPSSLFSLLLLPSINPIPGSPECTETSWPTSTMGTGEPGVLA